MASLPAQTLFTPEEYITQKRVAYNEPRFEDDAFDTLLNPVVIVEVLSPSTAAYDREEKFSHYKQMTSLQDYILVSQHKFCVEHFCRQDQHWEHTKFRAPEDVLIIPSIECKIPLRDIYMRVTITESRGEINDSRI